MILCPLHLVVGPGGDAGVKNSLGTLRQGERDPQVLGASWGPLITPPLLGVMITTPRFLSCLPQWRFFY
jgi:hypothetical protein